jgi:hypothetical protein
MSAIEQRARDLLAAEYIAQWRSEPSIGQPSFDVHIAALRAIVAALTPPEGFVLVPVEPTQRMVNAADDAYMPFGDMELAIQAAISSRPEVK